VKYEVLSTLFKNGGIADWEMIEDTYDFGEIWNKMLQFVDPYNMDFNDILIGAGDVYKEHIEEAINNKIREIEKQDGETRENINKLKELKYLDPSKDIVMQANYLDTHLFIEDKNIQKLYKKYLSKEIEEENNRIDFVGIDLEEE
jgi:hypothetical protein